MKKSYDLIVIGAGSIGLPTAQEFAQRGQSVLVIEALPSVGQGENKKAIGGVRATHSHQAKIIVCQRSIEIFKSWQERYGADINWRSHGYSFPAYTEKDELRLKGLMASQRHFGLKIEWLSAKEYKELTPGINMAGLRGSTYSPQDGSASPLLFAQSSYFKAKEAGAVFLFQEACQAFKLAKGRVISARTEKGEYFAANFLNATGSAAAAVSRLAGVEVPVWPDCHEAAVSEPVKAFMGPMVVDRRRGPGSDSFYFYQAPSGHVIFCLTPHPPIPGTDNRATSVFLPLAARRLIKLMPLLANLRVRRTWRGQYPMTPDGFPIVGQTRQLENFYLAVGMCGQGFMLGPGLAEFIFRLLNRRLDDYDKKIIEGFSPYRDFSGQEAFG